MDNYSIKQDPPIHMNYAAAKAHVAEWNNHTIQEYVWATYNGLPYTHLPHILVKYLVTEAARKLIFFKQTWCLQILHSMDEYYKDTGSEGKNESNNEDSEEEVTEE